MPERDVGTQSTMASQDELGGDATLPMRGGALESGAPKTIGRYQVVRMLGAGGMGVVYAAHDPELGRTVAIKLVRERLGGLGATLRDRLRREAQALARLTHPNVVSIHDVGVDGDQLFIVMQYVDGAPLDDWIASRKSDREEIVRLYLQAGRGLAAAHAAGLVHRDFKPGNVLVEKGGHVRVTDFGLARLSHLAEMPSSESIESSNDALLESMTRGDVVGTPAYMAPEQHLGGAMTAATDQFGFCVALWEALTGARPFTGATVGAIRTAVVAGKVDAPARPLPRRIQRALVRGLSVKADARWPSMDALLAQLEPPRRWWLAAGAAVVLVGGGAVAAAVVTGGGAPAAPCAGVGAPADAAWTPARQKAVHDTAAAIGANADEITTFVAQRFTRWKKLRIEMCEATKIKKTETAAALADHNACLDKGLAALVKNVDKFVGDVSPDRARSALGVAHSGNDGQECRFLSLVDPHPPELQARYDELDRRYHANDMQYFVAKGPGIADELEKAGDLWNATSTWLDLCISNAYAAPDDERDACRKAAVLAAREGNDQAAATALAWEIDYASDAGDLDGIDDQLAVADQTAQRTGAPYSQWEVDLTRGNVEERRGNFDKTIQICERVLADSKALYGPDSLSVDHALTCLGTAYRRKARRQDAADVDRQLLDIRSRTDGKGSVAYIGSQMQFALERLEDGDANARDDYIAAIAAQEKLDGGQTQSVMDAWGDLAISESAGAQIWNDDAYAAAEKAVAIGRKILDHDDVDLARMLEIHAGIRFAKPDMDGAMHEYEEALAIYDHSSDKRHWAELAFNTAIGYRNMERCDRALPPLKRILELADAGEIPRVNSALARGELGACARMGGQLDDARDKLTGAVADLDALGEPVFAAQYRLELAEVAWKSGKKDEARKIAQDVKDTLEPDGGLNDSLRQQADDWYLKPKPRIRAGSK